MIDGKLQIVSFGQAKRLKEAGFDWVCDAYYFNEKLICNQPTLDWGGRSDCQCSAPTVALALKWARDVKNMQNGIAYVDKGMRLYYYGKYQNKWLGFIDKETINYDTYEQAESALLDDVLDEIERGVE